MEEVKVENVDRFIQIVIERKNEVLGQSGLNDVELHYFLAGMDAAIFALRKIEDEDGRTE